MKNLCVYCGASVGKRPDYAAAARQLGESLVQRDIGLVYGGGGDGIMGALADTVMARGGRVTGIIPRALKEQEHGHKGITELIEVTSMHERKAMMAERSDAFLALPGGLGTLEELLEVLTWAQLRFHDKPCALLNVNGYYDPLLALLDHAEDEGFMHSQHRQLLMAEAEVEPLLNRLQERARQSRSAAVDLERI